MIRDCDTSPDTMSPYLSEAATHTLTSCREPYSGLMPIFEPGRENKYVSLKKKKKKKKNSKLGQHPLPSSRRASPSEPQIIPRSPHGMGVNPGRGEHQRPTRAPSRGIWSAPPAYSSRPTRLTFPSSRDNVQMLIRFPRPPVRALCIRATHGVNTMKDTTQLYETCRTFAEVLAEWDGEEVQVEAIAENIQQHMTPSSRAVLAFQILTNGSQGDDALSHEDKRFAVDLAEEMGADWAQWLYKFAVLVTKLA